MFLTPDSLTLTRTPAFAQLLRDITPHLKHMEGIVTDAATKGEPYETIRYKAGRLDGARYFLGLLEHAKKEADGRKESPGSSETS